MWRAFILTAGVWCLSGCDQIKRGDVEPSPTSTAEIATTEAGGPLNMSFEKKAWAECVFELDKIEIIHGRNLDDLDDGNTSARNQFMVDCLAARDAPAMGKMGDFAKYLDGRDSRRPRDMMINSALLRMAQNRESR